MATEDNNPFTTVYVPAAPNPPPPMKLRYPIPEAQPHPLDFRMLTCTTDEPQTRAKEVDNVIFQPTNCPLRAETFKSAGYDDIDCENPEDAYGV